MVESTCNWDKCEIVEDKLVDESLQRDSEEETQLLDMKLPSDAIILMSEIESVVEDRTSEQVCDMKSKYDLEDETILIRSTETDLEDGKIVEDQVPEMLIDESVLVKGNAIGEAEENMVLAVSCPQGQLKVNGQELDKEIPSTVFDEMSNRELLAKVCDPNRIIVSLPQVFGLGNCTWVDTGQDLNRGWLTVDYSTMNHSNEDTENMANNAAKMMDRGVEKFVHQECSVESNVQDLASWYLLEVYFRNVVKLEPTIRILQIHPNPFPKPCVNYCWPCMQSFGTEIDSSVLRNDISRLHFPTIVASLGTLLSLNEFTILGLDLLYSNKTPLFLMMHPIGNVSVMEPPESITMVFKINGVLYTDLIPADTETFGYKVFLGHKQYFAIFVAGAGK